jgi:hypothetical protein
VVQWSIAVHGVVEGWPEFERVFPIVVFPAHAVAESTPEHTADSLTDA